MEKKKMKIWKTNFFLSLAKTVLDPDQHQLEKWDPDPHKNFLDLPHCLKSLFKVNQFCFIDVHTQAI